MKRVFFLFLLGISMSYGVMAQTDPRFIYPENGALTTIPGNGYYYICTVGNKVGVVGTSKVVVVPIEYDEVVPAAFNFYLVRKGDKWGAVNVKRTEYQEVLPIAFDEIIRQKDGSFLVRFGDLWGLKSNSYRELLATEYTLITPIPDGQRGYLVQKDGKYGLTDERGNINLPIEYDEIRTAELLSKGVYLIRQGELWGEWSFQYKKFYIPLAYNELQPTGRYEGHNAFVVRIGDRYGLINGENKILVPIVMQSVEYSGTEDFKFVAADGTVYSSADKSTFPYDIHLLFNYLQALDANMPVFFLRFDEAKRIIVDAYDISYPLQNGVIGIRDRLSEKVRYLNTQGEWVNAPRPAAPVKDVRTKYNDFHEFSEGLAAVRKSQESEDNPLKWGFIDKSGKVVIPFMFSKEPSDFHNGLALIHLTNDYYVYINKKGEVVSAEIDYATPFCNGYAIIGTEEGRFAIDSTLNVVNDDVPGEAFWFERYDRLVKQQEKAAPTTHFFSLQADYGGEPIYIDEQGRRYTVLCDKEICFCAISNDVIHIRYDLLNNELDLFCDQTGKVIFMLERNKF